MHVEPITRDRSHRSAQRPMLADYGVSDGPVALSLFDQLVEEPPAPSPPAVAEPPLLDAHQPTTALASGASDTSKAAALKALPNSGTQRHRVLTLIAQMGDEGATDEEMQGTLRLGHNSQTPRRRELVLGGWICDSGRRRRTASTDSEATVWVLTEWARRQLVQAS